MKKIEEYAVIGNGRAAALVARDGAIDWLCLPRFESPSFFGGLLDNERGGTWRIAPVLPASSIRCYVGDTQVLRTEFQTDTGKMILTDFMPVCSEEERRQAVHPDHELIRRVECAAGAIEVEIYFSPSPDYGRRPAFLQNRGLLGLRVEIGEELFALHSQVELELIRPNIGIGRVKMKEGDCLDFSLTYTSEAPAVIPTLGELVSHKLTQTLHWWQQWAKRAKYLGPYREAVVRSALVLKVLGYAPSGAIVAAPTTSLPERIGGDLNWDYRYCWLRDASFAVRALLELGYHEEADAFVSWMLHSTRLTSPELKVVYDVHGENTGDEEILMHLRGYGDSAPVRVGNAAHNQIQLDVYGEVIDGIHYYVQKERPLDRDMRKTLRRIGHHVCKHWNTADSSIWENRVHIRHHTFSYLLCWVALDRLLQMHKTCQLSQYDVATFTRHRQLIQEQIETRGWNHELSSYVSMLDGNEVDASLLLMPYYNYNDARSPRMQQTYHTIIKRLQVGSHLLYRDEDMIGQEGAFLLCGLWKADFLARAGRKADAEEALERTLQLANDVGLFSEEIDPKGGGFLGNFPQAYTHLGIISAALVLNKKKVL